LNAEPEAAAAFPGSFGAVELRHVCDGCPVPLGFEAAKAPAAASALTTAASMAAINILMDPPFGLRTYESRCLTQRERKRIEIGSAFTTAARSSGRGAGKDDYQQWDDRLSKERSLARRFAVDAVVGGLIDVSLGG
jgi:hypothetical protein